MKNKLICEKEMAVTYLTFVPAISITRDCMSLSVMRFI